jgi:predicted outer membrane repeat protein
MKLKRLLIPAILGLGLALLWLVGNVAFSATAALDPTGMAEGSADPVTYHVDASVTGGAGDGSTWSDAFGTLQEALNAVQPGDQIWVAQGVYTPTEGTGCNATFQVVQGVAVYGGFEGVESDLSERRWSEHLTVLSGDVDGNDNTGGGQGMDNGIVERPDDIDGYNACHVVSSSSVTESAILDGFVITAGDARDTATDGGGLHNSDGGPTLVNIIFSGNRAQTGDGGALYNGSNGDVVLSEVVFSGNTAGRGGGMFNGGTAALGNVMLSGNDALQTGAAVHNDSSGVLTAINSTFSNNSALVSGGALYNNGGNADLVNCLLWDNSNEITNDEGALTTISYSDVQHAYAGGSWDPNLGTDGGGNMDVLPLLKDADGYDDIPGTLDDELILLAGSPCIDAGTDIGAPADDFEGDPRPWDLRPEEDNDVDIGADEFSNCHDLDEDGGEIDIDDLQTIANRWHELADHPPYDSDGDGITTVVEIMRVTADWGGTCP